MWEMISGEGMCLGKRSSLSIAIDDAQRFLLSSQSERVVEIRDPFCKRPKIFKDGEKDSVYVIKLISFHIERH